MRPSIYGYESGGTMIRDFLKLSVVCVAMAAGVAACSGGDDDDDGSSGNPPEIGAGSTVAGPFTGATNSGNISATVASAFADAFAPIGITGTMTLTNGSSLTLTGSIDDATHAILLSGSNASGSYSFNGSSADGRITGTWTGPADGGSFSLVNTTGDTAQLFCGTFTIPAVASGTFEMAVTADFLAGIARDSEGGGAYLEGTRSGDSLEFDVITDDGVQATGTGTVSGTTASGSLYGPNGEDPPKGAATWQTTACPS